MKSITILLLLLITALPAQVFRSYSADNSLLKSHPLTKRRHLTREYREDGSLASESQFHNGRRDGLTQEYYPDGKLKAEIYFKNGREHGTARFYYPSGLIRQKIVYERGKVDEQYFYNEEGHLTAEHSTKKKHFITLHRESSKESEKNSDKDQN